MLCGTTEPRSTSAPLFVHGLHEPHGVVVARRDVSLGLHAEREEYTRRIQQYMNKAIHEAKVNLSWVNENPEYVAAMNEFIARLLEPGTARRRIRSAASIRACAHAIGNATPWFCPMGRPNTLRSLA